MTRTLAEILLFTSLAINAALLIFIAGVLRMVMNDMNQSEFKQFVVSLVHHSKKSPFMLTVLNIPFVGAIPYFYIYRCTLLVRNILVESSFLPALLRRVRPRYMSDGILLLRVDGNRMKTTFWSVGRLSGSFDLCSTCRPSWAESSMPWPATFS